MHEPLQVPDKPAPAAVGIVEMHGKEEEEDTEELLICTGLESVAASEAGLSCTAVLPHAG